MKKHILQNVQQWPPLTLEFSQEQWSSCFFYSQIIPLLSNYTQDFQNIYTSYFLCVYVQSCPTVCDSMNCNLQAPLSLKFSRQKYWSGLPFPPPGNLPNPRIQPVSLASHWQADSLPLPHLGSPWSSVKPGESVSHSVVSDSLGPHGL